jgi:hypothetical protein
MTHSPANAEKSGSARKVFIAAILNAVDAYLDRGLTIVGLGEEVLAAARQYRRAMGGRR